MAQKRMFSKQIVQTDAFLDMPQTCQNLYFHLAMEADDDGFVGNPRKILRMLGVNDDDLKILIVKRFILTFESGVVVIKHWRMHNTLRKDRYTVTAYQEEAKALFIKQNKAYTNDGNQIATKWQPREDVDVDVEKKKGSLDKDIKSFKKNNFNP